LFVTATGTDTGKTTVTAALAIALRGAGGARGTGARRVGVLKPIASGCPIRADVASAASTGAGGQLATEDLRSPDAAVVMAAAGLAPEDPAMLRRASPVRWAAPISPHLAARLEGRGVDWRAIADAAAYWEQHCDFLLVEGAGGWTVPLDANDFTVADLAAALGLPVLLVTDAALGVLNTAVLTAQAIRARGLTLAGLVVNHVPDPPDLVAKGNLEELPRLCRTRCWAALAQRGGALDPAVFAGQLEDLVRALVASH
jgi:dethiobiotin synthetase